MNCIDITVINDTIISKSHIMLFWLAFSLSRLAVYEQALVRWRHFKVEVSSLQEHMLSTITGHKMMGVPTIHAALFVLVISLNIWVPAIT